MPVLESHPLLKNYAEVSPGMMRQVCHTAIGSGALSRGDVLFSEGEMASLPVMYFVTQGTMKYQHRSGNNFTVLHGEWSCEAAMWTYWIHCGHMRAKSECTLLVLDAQTVAKISTQFQASVAFAQRYGHGFVKHLNNCEYEDLTDLEDREMGVQWLADKSRPQEFVPQQKKLSVEIPPHSAGVLGGLGNVMKRMTIAIRGSVLEDPLPAHGKFVSAAGEPREKMLKREHNSVHSNDDGPDIICLKRKGNADDGGEVTRTSIASTENGDDGGVSVSFTSTGRDSWE